MFSSIASLAISLQWLDCHINCDNSGAAITEFKLDNASNRAALETATKKPAGGLARGSGTIEQPIPRSALQPGKTPKQQAPYVPRDLFPKNFGKAKRQ